MRTFAKKTKAPQQTTSVKSTIPAHSDLGQSREVNSILQLQRSIGNQAVQRMLQTNPEVLEVGLASKVSTLSGYDLSRIPIHPPSAAIQTKLAINKPGDIFEQEADRVTEQVMRIPEPQLERACPSGDESPTCKTERSGRKQEHLHTKRTQASDMGQNAAPPIVHTVLAAPGQPLDMATRRFMEPRFGCDFSQVRVHADAKAAESANAVNALAYTAGQDVVFGAGRYAPGTSEGGRLLAHELAHTIQQRPPQASCGPGSIDLHAGANAVGNKAHGAVRLRAATALARQPAAPPSPITLPSEGVEMPWVGKGGTNSSELGYLRDPVFFWVRFRAANPAALSTANNGLINNGGSPVVDDDWIRAYPQHAAYRGQVLEHHHVGQGSKAVPIPSGLHDAYTVFHPQRRVVGTPARGTKPLPPQPTHSDAQAEIDRHVAAGRIRGLGIAPGSSPRAPAIPPASAVAGVSSQRTTPVRAPTQRAPATPAVSSIAPASRAPRAWSGRQSVGAAGAAIAGEIIDMIGTILLQRYFADQLNEHASAKINAAITAFDLDAFLATHEQQIIQAQAEGWEVRIRIAIDTNWQSTKIGSVLMEARVADCQILYENQPQPKPYSRSQGGFARYALRTELGTTWDSQTIEILLDGTDRQQRRYRKSRAEIDAMLKVPAAGGAVEYESLLIQGQMGKVPLNELRDYTEHMRKRAEARGDPAAAKYWLSMETLAIGPVENLIDQAKIKGLPLAHLRQYASDTAAVAGRSGDRASLHSYHVWSTAVGRIDAPLTDQQSGDRQRYLWSQPASEAELGACRDRITVLEGQIAALEQQVATLRRTDARTAAERAGGEPPHPPWARINQKVEEIARLKRDLVVERLMLRDAERKPQPTR